MRAEAQIFDKSVESMALSFHTSKGILTDIGPICEIITTQDIFR